MTFEQEEPPVDGDKNADAPDVDPAKSAHAGNDAWLKRWLSRDKNPAVKKADQPQAMTNESASGGPADSDDSEDNVPEHTAADKATEPQPTSRFASAVENFRANTPVLLDAREPEEDEDEDIVIEGILDDEPKGFGSKLKAAFLSERTTAAFGVVGELLITGGTVVLLFLAWQLWINNAIVAGEQAEAVKEFSNGLSVSPSSSAKWTPKAGAKDYGPPPVLSEVGPNGVMGNMYVPRLGSGTTRAVANGVTNPSATINRGYYGRYENSQWPGQPGNFAMAVHRTGWGTSFTQAQTIRPGDHFYFETPQGWYIYTVRNTEYVVPTQVDVINPVPLSQDPPVDGQSIMTITTCSPMNGNGERLVIYGILSAWQPLEAGIPTEITKLVEEARS